MSENCGKRFERIEFESIVTETHFTVYKCYIKLVHDCNILFLRCTKIKEISFVIS